MDKLAVTDRTKLHRHPERAQLDRATLDAILDQGWIVHVGFNLDGGGAPFVIPTTYVRIDRVLYIHGAVASRVLRAAATDGVDLCATVTLIDGLVLARSAFHHSMNYRSVVALGRARLVEDDDQKARVLAALVDRLIPGRTAIARAPSPQELRQTAVLALPLEEASVKVRTGPPIDAEADLGWPAWTGVIPLAMASGAPQPEAGVAGTPGVAGAAGTPPLRTLAGLTSPAPAVVTHPFGEWALSDDRARIDYCRVSEWLAQAYWCPGIPRPAVEQAARHSSLVVGAYGADGTQVGYLRVVSDRTRFANIMDVFVAEPQRRRGLGRALVRFALAHPAHRDIPRWLLGTKDAHGVYAHEGFRLLESPERLMQRTVPPTWEVR